MFMLHRVQHKKHAVMSWFFIISVTFFIVMLSAFPWHRHLDAQWQSFPIHMFLHAVRSLSVLNPSHCFNFPRRRLDSLAICIRLLDVKKSVATIFVYPQNSSSNLKNQNTKNEHYFLSVPLNSNLMEKMNQYDILPAIQSVLRQFTSHITNAIVFSKP